jgi:hypothetical protein
MTSRTPSRPHRIHRPSAGRLLGWFGAAIVLVVALHLLGLGDLSARLVALAQRADTAAYLPATVRDGLLSPGQVATQTPAPPAATATSPATPPAPATAPPWPFPAGPDALAETLAGLGIDRSTLGYRPRGDWTRFPLPERTGYLLPMFSPLFEDPFRAYAAARTMGNAAERWLRPGDVNQPGLFKAAYYLGFDRKVGNFREYSVNLHASPNSTEPLKQALREVYQYAHADLAHYSFGAVSSWDNAEELINAQLPHLSLELQTEVARGLLNQLDAIQWRDRGLRKVDPELARRAFAIRDLGDSQGDGTVYYPELDDLMAQVDEPSLYYGALKAVESAQGLRLQVARLPDAQRCPAQMVDLPTPFGRLVVGSCGADTFTGDDVLLSVDPGGDDHHEDNAGGTAALEIPVALAVDVAGNDIYDCTAMAWGACQGAGILGAGILADSAGDDTYRAHTHAQGAALIGEGVLIDAAGTDRYEADWVAQGAAFFGHGLLMEAGGNDTYRLLWDGQGYGGVGGGVGVLADRGGDDSYFAEPDARNTPQYPYRNYAGNGQPNTNISFAQGASAGRRGDGSDGHSWPGGLGALVDVAGNDRYQAGAFAQAYGYWYGIGLMYDGAGHDTYRSVYYSLASGAHYAVSGIYDEAGDDSYVQEETIPQSHAGAGLAFAWDFVNATIFDRAGNDRYESNGNCLGRSSQKGNAYLIDGAGDDRYVGGLGSDCVGSSDWQGYYGADPYRSYVTGHESAIFSLLLDLGGRDTYLAKDFATGATQPHPRAAEGRSWYQPEPDAATPLGSWQTYRAAKVWGLGVDRADGTIPDFNFIPPVPTPAGGGLFSTEPRDLEDGADRGPVVPVAPPR